MRFTKPAWVTHKDAMDKKRVGIFSIHVHPDGSRIATGGLDAKIRIWSTLPILRPEFDDTYPQAEKNEYPAKLLCTLTMHAGPVLAVRWSHNGKWLASGSDDTVVMIWDLDPMGGGKVWGSDDTNIEGWKALKRLPGHDSDVTDIAFSPDDRYLASVGLDSKVLIWSGITLELIRTLDLHQGYVKGVCWDPVGQYLATQSDDKSVKIWNTTDWSLEASITQPFENSPGSTFFRRLSWSPDGAHITASNAMNNNGYVFVAAVISRSSWSSNISLVGHENTVEVSAYNPHIFRRVPDKPVTTSNICSVVALGSDDLTVSIWQTKSARPLIVARDVFERPIMDLSWSQNGLTLYACSSDGTIGVFDFDDAELEGIAPLSVQADYLKLFNFTPPPVSQSYMPQPQPPLTIPEAPRMRPWTPPQQMASHHDQSETYGSDASGKKKRRIKPVFVSHLSSQPGFGNGLPASFPQGPAGTFSASSHVPQPFGSGRPAEAVNPFSRDSVGGLSSNGYANHMQERLPSIPNPYTPQLQQSAFMPGPPLLATTARFESPSNIGTPEGFSEMWDSIDDSKRRVGSLPEDENIPRISKARTLGGDRRRESVGVIKELRPAVVPMDIDLPENHTAGNTRHRLMPPSLRTLVSAKVEDSNNDVFEGRNSEESSAPPEVSLINGKQTQFLDYVSSNVLAVAATGVFCAAALEDGTINVYSPTGRRLMPAMLIDGPCIFLEASKCFLMAISAVARIYIWNIKLQRAHTPPSLIQPLLSHPTSTITSASLRPNGSPIIILSTGVAFSFDPALSVWLKVSESRWGGGSDAWEGKQRATAGRNANSSRGIIASVEGVISELGVSEPVPNVQWWNAALTLGHLETRLHAAKLLDSPSEYKTNLILYAKRIAEEGFRAKAEELMKELCGPLYWKPTREETWTPTVLGWQKRELLKEVMNIFARSKTLARLGLDWQEIMKKVQAD